MSEENQVEEVVTEEETQKAPEELRLCKGTMPLPLVWYIKFHESKDNKSEVAKKYFTTPGKISDIQSGSNQKYIVENMSFTEDEIENAKNKVRENFVRGQAEEAASPGSVNKRGLATTQAGDEAYSLEILETIAGMQKEVSDEAVSLETARENYNAENPRASRKSDDTEVSNEAATTDGEGTESVAEAEASDELDDDLEGLDDEDDLDDLLD